LGGRKIYCEWGSVRSGALWRYCGTTERSGTKGRVTKVVFQNIIDDTSSAAESINGAKGYLKHLESFEFAFLTTTYNEIFNITSPLFNVLQIKNLDVNYCQKQIDIAADRIKKLRTDVKFDEIYKLAEGKLPFAAEVNVDGPPTKRVKVYKGIENDRQSYRILYFEIIDNIITQIEVRFKDLKQLSYFSLVDSFQAFSNHFPYNLTNSVCQQFQNVFEQNKLINELSVIYNDNQFRNLKISEMLKTFIDNDLRQIFSEAYKLLVLIASVPSTTVSVERNFSCLKRIKNYSRNTMCQSRLTSLALLSIEKGLLFRLYQKNDFSDEIIRRFALLKDNESI
jgi:hypothetical protein